MNINLKKLAKQVDEVFAKETNAEVLDKAPLIIHQRFCHELVSIAKKHEKQKMDEVPEFMDMLKAIEILENLYP